MITLVAGPGRGGLNLTSPSFVGRHRVFPWSIDTVLISIDPKLIFGPRGIIFFPFRFRDVHTVALCERYEQ